MLDCFSLQLEIRQRPPANVLRLQRNPLTLPQPVRAAVQALGAGKQLLALLELVVAAGVVAISRAEEGGAVVGEGFEFAFAGVDVGFVVAEAEVRFAARGRGDVLFFDAHLVELGGRRG